ncbi:CsbD family protein [Kribbia dieselivorans]|uniref:CsbD family protein n=1 Tax=Kribbia dieselivorans TaxID=331526 RepID=UPI0009F99D24|nr:CsbD family protein [Kribbia dieselivorans]
MGISDKFEDAKDQAVGEAKQKIGEATDDNQLQAEGHVQEAKGKLGETVENIKDKLS